MSTSEPVRPGTRPRLMHEVGPTGAAEFARACAAAAVLLAWVAFPSDQVAVLGGFGAATILLGMLEGYAARRLPTGPVRTAGYGRALGPILGGACLLVIAGDESLYRLALATGVLLSARGVGDLMAARAVPRAAQIRHWLLGLGLGEALAGLATLAMPDLFGQFVVAVLGLVWMAGPIVTILAPPPARVRAVTVAPYLQRSLMSETDRERIERDIWDVTRSRVVRFLVLLGSAALIATFGVLTNSIAAVIGAMIVAPLMEPIQGLTVALVAARPSRIAENASLLLAGILVVYLVSTFIAATTLDLSGDLSSASVVARTSPTLTDLAIAIAAGVVGSFALIRVDVSASLPGVAVAVSLVPPLCVSGVTLAGGDPHAALGAFLLFAVNIVAITAAGGAVLIVAGYGAAREVDGLRLLLTGGAVACVLGLLATPLATTGRDLVAEQTLESASRSQFGEWSRSIQPARLLDIEVDAATVTLLMTSAEPPPPTEDLKLMIEDSLDRRIDLQMQWVQAEPR